MPTDTLLDNSLFLSAFDPTDLPGTSIDPLGFERGYLFLADKILPGLTNVASRPRYFSVLCAGASLAGADGLGSARERFEVRREAVLRFERLWVLANVIATQEAAGGEDELPLLGLRGLNYVRDHVSDLYERRAGQCSANFRMLVRQAAYGVLGIYGTVAEGMALIDKKELRLTADLGERLATGFLDETEVPDEVRRAARENRPVGWEILAAWGARAHIAAPATRTEARMVSEILHRDPTRSRMARLLETYPYLHGDESEQERLTRAAQAMEQDVKNQDLYETTRLILAYEVAYRWAQLALERLIWLCKRVAVVDSAAVSRDEILRLVCDNLPGAVGQFVAALEGGQTEYFRRNRARLDDVHHFLLDAAAACDSPLSLMRSVLARHADVQHGKFDRGRRKMPWIEQVGERLCLTMTQVGGLQYEAASSDDIAAHPYRLAAADAYIKAGGQA